MDIKLKNLKKFNWNDGGDCRNYVMIKWLGGGEI